MATRASLPGSRPPEMRRAVPFNPPAKCENPCRTAKPLSSRTWARGWRTQPYRGTEALWHAPAHIDLGPLCRFASACLYHDEAISLDLIGQAIECRGRPPVRYDIVSFNIGSTPRTSDIPGATGNVVPVKPINQFIVRWQSMIDRVLARNNGVRIGVVGTGAGGVEILLAVQYRLRQILRERGRTDDTIEYILFGDTGTVLPDHSPRARKAFERELHQRRVQVLAGEAVTEGVLGLCLLARSAAAARRPIIA